MRHYVGGKWGFSLIFGIYGSVFPYAFTMAVVNAVLTFGVALSMEYSDGFNPDSETTETVATLLAIFSSVMMFILTFRSDIAYERWWEGGTLLQKTRGEWFNAYSSLVAFSSARPELQRQVMEFHHLLARLMSLLFCCALQQVSPSKERPFEILDTQGIELESLLYLESTRDKVEIILQWIQRSIVLRMNDGVLPVAPPVLSRAFQELSRGIVNLQNARKIADFPFPYPYAQLEAPFGDEPNDLPMDQMILDWNNSLCTLLSPRSQRPPAFEFDPATHARWITSSSADIPSMMAQEDEESEEDYEEELEAVKSNLSEHSSARFKIGKAQLTSPELSRQTSLRQEPLDTRSRKELDVSGEDKRKGGASSKRPKALSGEKSDLAIAKSVSDASPHIHNDLHLRGNTDRQLSAPSPAKGTVGSPAHLDPSMRDRL